MCKFVELEGMSRPILIHVFPSLREENVKVFEKKPVHGCRLLKQTLLTQSCLLHRLVLIRGTKYLLANLPEYVVIFSKRKKPLHYGQTRKKYRRK